MVLPAALLSAGEVAALLGISVDQLARHRRGCGAGAFVGFPEHVPGTKKFSAVAVARWLAGQSPNAPTGDAALDAVNRMDPS